MNFYSQLNLTVFIFSDKRGTGKRKIEDGNSSDSTNSDFSESSSDQTEQKGFGKSKKHSKDDSAFIEKIANIVVGKISSSTVDLSPNAPIIEDNNTKSDLNILPFDTIINKNDEADDFDENRLVGLIPNVHKKKAKELLKKINDNGHLITFNSSGVLFINGISIPNSNIFEIFPMLFKISKPLIIPGLLELINQIDSMKLSHLIVTKSKQQQKKNPKEESLKISDNFWYIG